ncbi:hypothetical protein BJ971_003056 [Actinoplanes digitatis]|uniref:Uncharacterized protein n=2 Tax=Actinoplanes digitatis TaxID=1868 RepID=A0A7W7MQE7_9ACTN|nr:hypothetical protein [Actinoplanes digitatis]
MFIAWLAGPENIVRYPEDRPQFWDVTVPIPQGHATHRQPETPDQAEMFDESVNSYLRDAGVPERPGGYRWFQVLPPGITPATLDSSINQALAGSGTTSMHPRAIRDVVAEEVARLYRPPA